MPYNYIQVACVLTLTHVPCSLLLPASYSVIREPRGAFPGCACMVCERERERERERGGKANGEEVDYGGGSVGRGEAGGRIMWSIRTKVCNKLVWVVSPYPLNLPSALSLEAKKATNYFKPSRKFKWG